MFGWELKIRLNCTIVSEQTEKCVQPFWYVNSILRMFVFLLVAYSLQLDSCKWTKWSACASRDRALCSAEALLEVIKYPREATPLVTRTHICFYMTSHTGGEMWDIFVCPGLYKANKL